MAIYKGASFVNNAGATPSRFLAASLSTAFSNPTVPADHPNWEANATTSITVHITTGTTGALPAGVPTEVQIFLYDSTGTTVVDTITLTNASGLTFPTSVTLNPTLNGLSGGAPILGTLRLYIRAIRNEPGVGTLIYDQNSDTQLTSGVVRFNPTSVTPAFTGHVNSQFSYGDTPVVSAVLSHGLRTSKVLFETQLYDVNTGTIYRTQNTSSSSTATHTGTHVPVGNNAWPPATTVNVGARLNVLQSPLVPDSELTLKYIKFPAGTPGFVSDSRLELPSVPLNNGLNIDHHLQLNDNTFHPTDPTLKDKIPKYRLVAEMGFMGCRITNTRGEGQNSITYSESLADLNAFASPVNRSPNDVTVTRGTQTGWSSIFKAWDSQLPSGTWRHTITVTAPTTALGLEIGKVEDFILLAPNPAISVRPYMHSISPNSLSVSDHAKAGQILRLIVTIVDTSTGVRVEADAGTMRVALTRYNSILGRLEQLVNELDNSSSWEVLDQESAQNSFLVDSSIEDSLMYVRDFYPTNSFGTRDVRVSVTCTVDSVPYHAFSFRELVGDENDHSGNALDAVQVGLHGVIGFK